MARSHCIYLVLINTRVVSAYTVKHEMQTAVDRKWSRSVPKNVFVKRVKDNGVMGEVEDITADVFGFQGD